MKALTSESQLDLKVVNAIALVVFEGIATLVQLIDPQGGLLHVKYFASRIMVKSTFLMLISPPS